jgi:hypothetical protein
MKPTRHAPMCWLGHKDVAHPGVLDELAQQQIGLIHAATRGKRPVGAHAFAGHALGVHDARIGVAARRNQPPQPRQRRRQNVKDAQMP